MSSPILSPSRSDRIWTESCHFRYNFPLVAVLAPNVYRDHQRQHGEDIFHEKESESVDYLATLKKDDVVAKEDALQLDLVLFDGQARFKILCEELRNSSGVKTVYLHLYRSSEYSSLAVKALLGTH